MIDSVFGQSFQDFSILVSDNASTDETAEVVAYFDDPRISRLEQNVGWCENFNRDRHPGGGMVHTGFDLVDADGDVLVAAMNSTDGLASDAIERGDDFDILERNREVKLRPLESQGHRWADADRLRADADWAPHREIVNTIRSATLPERRLAPTLKMLGASVGRHPSLALKREAWRLVGASLLGPRVVARMSGQ